MEESQRAGEEEEEIDGEHQLDSQETEDAPAAPQSGMWMLRPAIIINC